MQKPAVEILNQKNHNFLWVGGRLWMWDLPDEVEYQAKLASEAYGKVLVAGYGLGILQKLLCNNPLVDSVTTIELYSNVIKACEEFYGYIAGDIILCDFLAHVPVVPNEYDCVIGDIWIDIKPECLNQYEKFLSKANELIKRKGLILAWGKDYFDYLIEHRRAPCHAV